MAKAVWAAFGVVFLGYIAAAGLLPLASLDRMVLPDDTYYTLSIARNIAAGNGPSTDGVILTSGLQPLIAILMQPVFLIGLDGDAALRAVIVLSAAFGAIACGLAGRITGEATGSGALGALAVLFAGAATPLWANAMNGLETTLAAAILLWLVMLAMGTGRSAGWGRLVAVGALAGLAVWARIDSALMILVLAGVALVRLGPLRTGVVALTALIVAAPWMGYCLWIAGSPLPESGGAVRQIIEFHTQRGATAEFVIAQALRIIPSAVLPGALVAQIPLPGLVALHLLLALPLWLAVQARRMDAPAALVLAALAMLAFYVLYLPAFWFFHRYLHLAGLAMVVALLAGLGRLGGTRAALGLGAVLLLGQAAQTGREVWTAVQGPVSARQGYGYGDVADALLPLLPPDPQDVVLGAMQSGALTWHAPKGVRVVNLDGVVNGAAKQAIHDGALGAYLTGIGATHFADWPLNLDWLRAKGGADLTLVPLGGLADHDGPGQDFTLYRIDQ